MKYLIFILCLFFITESFSADKKAQPKKKSAIVTDSRGYFKGRITNGVITNEKGYFVGRVK